MTEQNPDDDLTARFRQDQEEAQAEQEDRAAIVWAHQVRDANTTMDQREAVTKRVAAQADLLETLNVAFIIALFSGSAALVVWVIAQVIGAVR